MFCIIALMSTSRRVSLSSRWYSGSIALHDAWVAEAAYFHHQGRQHPHACSGGAALSYFDLGHERLSLTELLSSRACLLPPPLAPQAGRMNMVEVSLAMQFQASSVPSPSLWRKSASVDAAV